VGFPRLGREKVLQTTEFRVSAMIYVKKVRAFRLLVEICGILSSTRFKPEAWFRALASFLVPECECCYSVDTDRVLEIRVFY
jgi:hypothetical protein